MTSRTLGTTGIAIPRAFLGCGTFGGIGGARHLVGRGLDGGRRSLRWTRRSRLASMCSTRRNAMPMARANEQSANGCASAPKR